MARPPTADLAGIRCRTAEILHDQIAGRRADCRLGYNANFRHPVFLTDRTCQAWIRHDIWMPIRDLDLKGPQRWMMTASGKSFWR